MPRVDVREQREVLLRRLAERRIELGLSQQELGDLVGIRQPVVSRIEHGVVSPQLDTFLALLDALKLRIDLEGSS